LHYELADQTKLFGLRLVLNFFELTEGLRSFEKFIQIRCNARL